MARFVLLDAGPLGLACGEPGTPSVDRCRAWLLHLEFSTAEPIIPAVADYEVRRELVRLGATAKLRRLKALSRTLHLDVRVAAFDRGDWALLGGEAPDGR